MPTGPLSLRERARVRAARSSALPSPALPFSECGEKHPFDQIAHEPAAAAVRHLHGGMVAQRHGTRQSEFVIHHVASAIQSPLPPAIGIYASHLIHSISLQQEDKDLLFSRQAQRKCSETMGTSGVYGLPCFDSVPLCLCALAPWREPFAELLCRHHCPPGEAQGEGRHLRCIYRARSTPDLPIRINSRAGFVSDVKNEPLFHELAASHLTGPRLVPVDDRILRGRFQAMQLIGGGGLRSFAAETPEPPPRRGRSGETAMPSRRCRRCCKRRADRNRRGRVAWQT